MKYFAYGSDMDPAEMKAMGIDYYSRSVAKLDGYTLKFNVKPSNKDFSIANIVESKYSFVEGVVYDLSSESIDLIEKYHQSLNSYNRIDVSPIDQNGNKIEAITYTSDKASIIEGMRPTQKYLNHLLQGKDLLSGEYFSWLQDQFYLEMTPGEDIKLITARYIEGVNLINLELFGQIAKDPSKAQPIYPFIEFIIDRFNAMILLLQENMLWDAEIIYRSVLETFFKCLFILSADEAEQKVRMNEFWVDLEEINRLKISEQAKRNLNLAGNDPINKIAHSPNVLSLHEENRLRAKWPKVKRKQLEQKWSFSEIIEALSTNFRGQKADQFKLALHAYRMASHVTHGDETGILIISERKQRSEADREIADIAHYLRLLSDIFSFTFWTASEAITFINGDHKPILKIYNYRLDLHEISNVYISKLYDDPDYDKYR